MSGDRQDQRVGEGGQAIQAGHNVIINQGVSAFEIAEILAKNVAIIEQYRYEAREEAESRFRNIEEKIQQKFSDEGKANTEAFKDPAFQFAVREAQEAFIKSGEIDVGETLVNILAQRSQVQARGIVGLVLDEAIEVSGKLSKPELSYLACAFFMLKVRVNPDDGSKALSELARILNPVLEHIPSGNSTASYLTGLGCMLTESIMTRDFHNIFISNYGYLFNRGFTKSEFKEALGAVDEFSNDLWTKLTRPAETQNIPLNRANFTTNVPQYSEINPLILYVFRSSNETEFKPIIEKHVENTDIREKLLALARSRYWSEEELWVRMEAVMPHIGRLKTAFVEGGLAQGGLTAKGIAIAHSYLAHIVPGGFSAPLSIWIN